MITNRDDDYLICKEYQSRIEQISSEYPDFITFQHPNGNHYFAWAHNGEIVLRSEAYPDEERMIRGIKAIHKNWDIPERYSVDVAHGINFLVLWGGGDHQAHTGNMGDHNEIGRSCPKKTREELHQLLLGKGKDFAQKVVPIDGDGIGAEVAGAATAVLASESVTSLLAEDRVDNVQETEESITTPIEERVEAVSHIKETNGATKLASAAAANTATTQSSTHYTGHSSTSVDHDSDASGGFKWWYLLPLLLLPLLWKMCNKETQTENGAEAVISDESPNTDVTTVVDTATVAIASFAKKLATGFELKGAAQNGIESQLVGFIEDASKTVDKTTWFNFDRLLFDSGKATLQASSQEQLLNAAEILKAFPNVKLKIGGYTDNVGNPKSNMKLSQDRANTVMSELIKLGVDKGRLTAEGYGDQHPEGDNNTEEGRQQNRRIALRVTEK